MFKPRGSNSTKVECIYTPPSVYIELLALEKMKYIVALSDKEVGWLGTAIKVGNDVLIEDVFLFEQEVAHTTCEIKEEGLIKFGEELLKQKDGVDIWNKIRVWGHSHVNMGVTPSGQDDKQMKTFVEGGHEWFVRVIANKSGEMKIDYYDFKANVAYLDVSWNVYTPSLSGVKEFIEKELKDKVTEKKYTYATYNSNGYNYGYSYGAIQSNINNINTPKKKEYFYEEKEQEEEKEEEIDITDIEWLLLPDEIYELSSCMTFLNAKELVKYFLGYGYEDDEIKMLWEQAKDLVDKWKYEDEEVTYREIGQRLGME